MRGTTRRARGRVRARVGARANSQRNAVGTRSSRVGARERGCVRERKGIGAQAPSRVCACARAQTRDVACALAQDDRGNARALGRVLPNMVFPPFPP
jgi:hypothetical protein